MSVLVLKIIAVVSMLLDHIGYSLDIYVLRCIGRLAFPIFAYLIGNGFRHTTSPVRYLSRLLLLAVLSQIPYTLFLSDTLVPEKLNIFFTLSLGLGLIWAMERCEVSAAKLLCVVAAVGVCLILEPVAPLDYGLRGVLLIAALYYYPTGSAMAISFLFIYYLPIWDALLPGGTLPSGWHQTLFGALALPLLYGYNGKAGYRSSVLQWAFYLFYPAHLLVLHVIFHG